MKNKVKELPKGRVMPSQSEGDPWLEFSLSTPAPLPSLCVKVAKEILLDFSIENYPRAEE